MTCLHTNLIRSFTQEKGLMFFVRGGQRDENDEDDEDGDD